MLQLSLLRVCWQLHREGCAILWTTNTYSFEDAFSFRHFLNDLNTEQRKALAKLHVDALWDTLSLKDWDESLSARFSKQLPALTTLHATFDQNFGHRDMNSFLRLEALGFTLFHVLELLLRIQVLPLKHATVIIADDVSNQNGHFVISLYRDARWAIEKKRQVAEALRLKLLNSKGEPGRT